jgi:hypothetical protein
MGRQGDKAVHMTVGESLQCYCPIIKEIGEGWFPKQGNVYFTGITGDTVVRTLERGWCLDNEEVGTITQIADKVGVTYTHNYPMIQYIYFFAATGETGVISVVPAPIHDHSSIVQGGPAFGTYFRDRNS